MLRRKCNYAVSYDLAFSDAASRSRANVYMRDSCKNDQENSILCSPIGLILDHLVNLGSVLRVIIDAILPIILFNIRPYDIYLK